MPCQDPFELTINKNVVPGVPNPSPRYDLLVDINGHPQKAPKGWKIPSCYFDLASLATAIGTLTVTKTATTATFTDVTNNVTTIINVPVTPQTPLAATALTTNDKPPVTTQYIGGGKVLLTEPDGLFPVTIGGVLYGLPLYLVVTPNP